MTVFETLSGLNVNDHTEQKITDGGRTTLTYLSWPWAWAEVKTRFPDAHYEVIKNENRLPYFSDDRLGIMVYTSVTIDGVTHEMWLPVMDGNNKAMRFEPYEIATKYKTIQVKAATMFDVNKTVMRCLVKNLAMFGLGLYIYAGEDLPETEADRQDDENGTDAGNGKPAARPGAARPEIRKSDRIDEPEQPKAGDWSFSAATSVWRKEHNMTVQKFVAARQAVIAAGLAPDIPSRDMTEAQAKVLFEAIERNIA